MAKAAAPFTQSDVTRAVKGAKAAGESVARIKILKDGSIEIDIGKPTEPAVDDLDKELQDFAARHGQG